ncbi:hypothetical protein BDA96_03G004200 [Sorghum bicolor]|uniref:Glutaredoxin domain-containing protein n=1 Tax=Sorghum bicolor TaxID=4558 RepID=A0A921RB68_SORBI|nr:uncharacterized protein LOC8078085 [Sorghum bicolor]KAG0535725.1 hypothetical protein BDA96_03G004200 [Sorghum bicolor]|eukprot:XP_002457054.2 uncharacterized protein LOC8078085 [Sorghum bicolor]
MGCASSKAGDDVAVADVYRPPPTSVSLFDITAVEEPWLIAKQSKAADDDDDDEDEETTTDDEEEDDDEKLQPAAKTVVPLPLLDKLEGYELAPASWSEVSKALEDMKPVLDSKPPPAPVALKKKKKNKTKKKKKKQQQPQQPTTTTTTAAPPPVVPAATDGDATGKKAPSPSSLGDLPDISSSKPAPPELAGRRVVKDNPFLMRDRESKGDGSTVAPRWKRRDPFEGCPERRPPGATGGGVVLYTTTLRGVRRTFEDCERTREAVEACAAAAGVAAVDERDVSLHGEYLRELRELVPAGDGEGEGAAAAPPRLFVMGRYVGGADECERLAESGKLREMMRWVKARGEACAAKDGRGCEGCGGARFVPCWECGGSCKVVAADGGTPTTTERCGKCNENGLMMCPICH